MIVRVSDGRNCSTSGGWKIVKKFLKPMNDDCVSVKLTRFVKMIGIEISRGTIVSPIYSVSCGATNKISHNVFRPSMVAKRFMAVPCVDARADCYAIRQTLRRCALPSQVGEQSSEAAKDMQQ